ncbi:MAG: phosphoribosylanthranilate isomerase [Prochlorothrix sp.]|nr:phosphoribosylanthranilate isomerase [Prochlorothrix sp.]
MTEIKICGLTRSDQVAAIAAHYPQFRAPNYLGFICVPQSPRFVSPAQIRILTQALPSQITPVGVFANATLDEVVETVTVGQLRGIQLHGDESLEFCWSVRRRFPDLVLVKALRIRTAADLERALAYGQGMGSAEKLGGDPAGDSGGDPSDANPGPRLTPIDALLLDAYHPQQLGGTGETLDWDMLRQFQPAVPWFLAGGLRPDNVTEALGLVQSQGVDVSSGVERSPGDKDLDRVAAFIEAVRMLA